MNESNETDLTGEDSVKHGNFVLRLFITGASVNSSRAVSNLRDICEKYLVNNYSLDIIDVYQQQTIAESEQIIALPLLIKSSPLPEKRLIGDMSDTQKVLKGLGITITA